MLVKVLTSLVAVFAALLMAANSASAQQTIYKWVDEDGVVHFSDARPQEPGTDVVETLSLPEAPPAAAISKTRVPAVTAASTPAPRKLSPAIRPAEAETFDVTKVSLGELDKRCDATRERVIAPLRAAEIAKCQEDRRNDPAWCERFNADFGDAGRTVSGTMRPRMFDDLPECAEALQERNRRRR